MYQFCFFVHELESIRFIDDIISSATNQRNFISAIHMKLNSFLGIGLPLRYYLASSKVVEFMKQKDDASYTHWVYK